jgi:GNAT superfamily N-acetyltransferase
MNPAEPNTLSIREVAPDDSAAVARLSGELGYPQSVETIRASIEALSRRTDHPVFVARLSGEVAGWIEVSLTHHLVAEMRTEIGGLVVASTVRSRGIGGQLVAQAELWAVARGVNIILVRSRIAREDAHRFYRSAGYAHIKTSAVFTKKIDDSGANSPTAVSE